jgi:hypothetical protein
MTSAYRRGVAALLTAGLLTVACPGCASSAPEAEAVPVSEDTVAVSSEAVPAASAHEREKPECLISAFHPEAAEEMEEGLLDCSALSEGYVALSAQDENRLKFQVSLEGESYTYDLPSDGTPAVFPLNMGSGTYQFQLLRCVGGTKYARVWETSRGVTLADEFVPFLVPSQMVNYNGKSACVAKAWELTKTCSSDVDVAAAIYAYLVNSISYDDAKASSVEQGYLPDPDTTLETGKGICFDYAALAAAMLRSQGIPCQLITGYVGQQELYHAWNRFYVQEQGWITAEIQAKGKDWTRVDITFASEGVPAEQLEDDGAYTTRYTY